MAGSMAYRREVNGPQSPHMKVFVAAMRAVQARLDNKGFNHIAGYHGAPSYYCWHHQFTWRTPLQPRLFLPWHRAYLLELEQALRDADDRCSLPWWDWTTNRAIPEAYRAASIDGESNPLRRFRMRIPATVLNPAINRNTRRNPGALPGLRLPTAAEVEDLLDDTDWASFSDRLQSYHDEVHVWIGGDMADTTTAGFDPIFYAHHGMIDRLWYLWQVRWGANRIPVPLLDLPLIPFGRTVAEVLDVQALGYEYAASGAGIESDGGSND